ncbi:hypothetical protein BGZ96_010805 [Linnemannia gamsii]|uniref:Uncharacterized protein n=1 Tax=Linnemannia gamsii TaxID=64522 RepID=A0ABQ7JTM4_9FUNG|nr:hypothetical protein BGZ96_010805 [Linnemannia gamsii]
MTLFRRSAFFLSEKVIMDILSRYLEWAAMVDPVCIENRNATVCRPLTRSYILTVMGMNVASYAILLAVMVIAKAIVSLKMDKRARDTSKLTASQDLENKRLKEKA